MGATIFFEWTVPRLYVLWPIVGQKNFISEAVSLNTLFGKFLTTQSSVYYFVTPSYILMKKYLTLVF